MPAASGDHPRKRAVYLAVAVLVIALGLGTRRFPWVLPDCLGKYPGDALWATLVFLLVAVARPCWRGALVAAVALGTAMAVEISQLCQAPWLVALRRTIPGRLVLGTTFVAWDLAAYAIGVALGLIIDHWLRGRRGPPHPRLFYG